MPAPVFMQGENEPLEIFLCKKREKRTLPLFLFIRIIIQINLIHLDNGVDKHFESRDYEM